MENSYKSDIAKFISEMSEKYGMLPKFAHNLVAKNPEKVYYGGPYFDNKELEAAIEALLFGKWSSGGEICMRFEQAFSAKINTPYSYFCNSGSSANLLLIAACKEYFGWKDGDEIIVSPVGFPTTVSAIVHNGLVPVFIDIEWQTLNFDLTKINLRTSPKTKAIFLSPVLGNPPNIDQLLEICKYNNVELLLDNCDSLGSKWNGKYLNEYAAASSCSFYPAHEITTLEGGMVSSKIFEIVRLARSFASWGRDCFPEGTMINVNESFKPIEKIKIGEKVISHLGNVREVKDVFSRPYTGDMIEICGRLVGKIKCTSNHKFYVESNGSRIWKEAKDIHKKDYLLERLPVKNNSNRDFRWKYNTDINNFSRNESLSASEDLMRFIGYWLAEGSIDKSLKGKSGYKENKYFGYRISFSFNASEEEYHNDVINLGKKIFNSKGKITIDNNSAVVNFKSRRMYEFFKNFFSSGACNKSLPEYIVGWDDRLIKQLLFGFFLGDGSEDWQGQTISSCSFALISQFRRILLRLGILSSFHYREPERHKSSFVKNRLIIAKNNLYTLSIYGKNAELLSKHITIDKFVRKSNRAFAFFSDDGLYAKYPVYSVNSEKVENLPIYNLTVSEDNSYHANNIAVHNCYCVGAANLLPNGVCGKRFSNWLVEKPDLIIDHKYSFGRMGWNLKPLDLQAAIGLEQLKKLDFICKTRQDNYVKINELFLRYVPTLRTPHKHPSTEWVPFGVPFISSSVELKNKLVAFLEKNGIQTRNYFAGNLLLHNGYKHLADYRQFPSSNEVLDLVFFVGCAPTISSENLLYIEKVLKSWQI